MAYEDLIVERGDDFVATITFNRPERLNTFTMRMAGELADALAELEADPDARVIILRGEGRAFCAGIDVTEVLGKPACEQKQIVERMERPLVGMSRMGTPVIAQVSGTAAANGAGLVAAADLAVCGVRARIGFTAVNVGLFCLGPAVPLARLVGRKKALELLLYGRLIKADEALEMGLVNQVVPEDQLEETTRKWAAELAAKSPLAVQLGKQAFYAAEDLDYHRAFDYMNEAFARLCGFADTAEGIKAFKDKRDPVWQGR